MNYENWKENYLAERSRIMQSNLNPRDKHNAIRYLANLSPHTQQEYEQHLLSLKPPTE